MNKFTARLSAVTALVLASTGSAFAALPADVTTAMADMKADGVLIGGAFLVVVIAIAAVKILRKGA